MRGHDTFISKTRIYIFNSPSHTLKHATHTLHTHITHTTHIYTTHITSKKHTLHTHTHTHTHTHHKNINNNTNSNNKNYCMDSWKDSYLCIVLAFLPHFHLLIELLDKSVHTLADIGATAD